MSLTTDLLEMKALVAVLRAAATPQPSDCAKAWARVPERLGHPYASPPPGGAA
jgi:hypothetical protein